jgi:demethylmenaquinone methyltransferase / 2-methoxy-6-polyprenyl-1,4-benzoquinol methylase
VSEPLPSGEDKARVVRGMFDRVAPRYDLVNRVMTLGMDAGWRRRAVRALHLPPGSLVLDLACGTGDLCRELERGGYRSIGFDFSIEMLRAARIEAPLVQADILRLPVGDASADGVTCGFALRNVVSLKGLFDELARVVRPGGAISLLDASRPDNRVFRAGHAVYFEKIVPLIGGVLSDRAAYRYLPRSMAYLPPTGELVAMLRRAGFPSIRRLQLSGGITQLYVGTRA